MKTPVLMPKLGAGVFEEAKIVKWLKNVGDYVKEGEELVEIETEKAVVSYESPASGFILKFDADLDESIAIGEPICTLVESAEFLDSTGNKPTASTEIFPSKNKDPASQEFESIPLSPMRATIAQRLTKSLHESAQVTLFQEFDASALVSFVEQERTQKISYTEIFVKTVALALKHYPVMNSFYENTRIKLNASIVINVAVALENGLIAPGIKDPDSLSLIEIRERLTDLVKRAKEGNLRLEELGGTFSVSNLGMLDVDYFTPIINPPQSGILGIGRINEKPGMVNGRIEPRHYSTLSLTFDHRVLDGADAARFLQFIVELVLKPEKL
jgi:pyruvate dehydrogenase E2 component (dihydrolipoamide acetyltransferase)